MNKVYLMVRYPLISSQQLSVVVSTAGKVCWRFVSCWCDGRRHVSACRTHSCCQARHAAAWHAAITARQEVWTCRCQTSSHLLVQQENFTLTGSTLSVCSPVSVPYRLQCLLQPQYKQSNKIDDLAPLLTKLISCGAKTIKFVLRVALQKRPAGKWNLKYSCSGEQE